MLTTWFKADPTTFCDKHPLVVEAGFKDHASHLQPKVVEKKAPDNYQAYYRVLGKQRVVYFDLQGCTRSGSVQGAQDQAVSVRLFARCLSNELEPCYFLPYNADEAYRITLKDKRAPTDIPAGKAQVNYFFTEQLDGCSIVVEGDPKAPTVYHLNAKGHGSFTGKYKKDLKIRAGKEDLMKNMYANTPAPKSVRQGVGRGVVPNATTLMPSDYMGFDPKTLKSVSNDFKDQFGLEDRRVVTDTKATVFGIRDTATLDWSFYCQVKMCFMYEKCTEKHMFGPDHWVAEGHFWAPVLLEQFYPGRNTYVLRSNVAHVI